MIVSYKMMGSICKEIKNKSIDDILKAFDSVGIEVESMYKQKPVEGLKFVKIINIKKHPNADNLSIVKIQSDNEVLDIVCGAKNLLLYKWAVFAPVGTKLPNGIEIAKRNIRGFNSNGMLCGYNELTDFNVEFLSNREKDGIVILNEKDIENKSVIDVLNLNDIIFDLSIASNRNDLNSYNGIIQEIAPILNIDFKLKYEFENLNDDKSINITINKNICSSFGILSINDAPLFNTSWTQKTILIAHGIKIQNNWNDFFNLISLIYNTPITIYDYDKLNNDPHCEVQLKINFTNKETEVMFNEQKVKLDVNTPCIFNNDKIVGICGLGPIDDYKYTSNTNNLLVALINYDDLLIRTSCQKLKLNNRNSSIFSKPLSNWLTINAFYQLVNYLQSFNYNISKNFVFNWPMTKCVNFDFDNFNKFIGINLDKQMIVNIFKKMNFLVDDNLIYFHPSRLDISNQYDLYEELLKIININDLEVVPIYSNVISQSRSNEIDSEIFVRNYFVNNGFYEVKTYNLTSEQKYKNFNFFNQNSEIKIINPVSNIRQYYRYNCINSFLEIIRYNIDHKREIKSIFEIQKFDVDKKGRNFLNILCCDSSKNYLINYEFEWNIFTLKTLIANLFENKNLTIEFEQVDEVIDEIYNNQCLAIKFNDAVIGYIGRIKNSILNDEYGIDLQCLCAIVDLSILSNLDKLIIKPISQFQPIIRDINIELDSQNNDIHSKIKIIKQTNNVIDCKLKSFFIKENKYIYTLSISICNFDKTLTNDEINKIVSEINEAIK